MVEKNKKYVIKIDSLSSDGNGVGAIDGFTVFVPVTAPGDVAEIVIVKVLSRYAIGRLLDIVKPSANRADPVCPVFRRCGGCHLQHIKYEEQLNAKRGFIEDAFKRIGGFDGFKCTEMLGMDRPLRYRNKCIFPIGAGNDGRIVSGFYARRSHDIIPVSDCIMCSGVSADIKDAVTGYMNENDVLPYDEVSHKGLVRRVFIRNAAATGEIMVVVSVNGDNIPRRERLIKRLRGISENIVSIYVNVNKKKTNSVLGEENKLIYGIPEITDILCGMRFKISPHSFYQVNPYMTERLYNKALEFAGITENDTVLDVYCGIGTISLAAAKAAKRVIGIEIVNQAVEDARKNAENNGIKNAVFYAESAENAVPKLIENGMRPDIAILDPPRKGSDAKTLSAIVSAEPKRIVYVSCNVSTLARDAAFLAEQGYYPIKCAGADMFPHTCHVETVCQLVLRRSPVHINIDVNVEELVRDKRGLATYEQIKEYVLEHIGLKVSSLYIAQVKRKYGIIEWENYNKPKSEDTKQLICPPEKEEAIKEALEHFGMI